MKALVVDSAVTKLIISAKNDDKSASLVLNIGMKQSQTLLGAIDYVLEKVELTAADLDYLALTSGPGSFTGLRLSYSALKAISLAFGTPIYGLSALKCYSNAYINFDLPVLSCIDANKERFYCGIYKADEVLLADGDYTTEELLKQVEKYENLIISGPDALKFSNIIKEKIPQQKFICPELQPLSTESLFILAEEKINKGEKPLEDYDGPVYLRASEAEILHNQKAE